MVLDEGWPVCLVRVEAMEEVLLDPEGRDTSVSAVPREHVGQAEAYFVTWPSLSNNVLICDRSSGSRVAAEWFAAEGGTLTGVEDAPDMVMVWKCV